jgi:hypothetical protein
MGPLIIGFRSYYHGYFYLHDEIEESDQECVAHERAYCFDFGCLDAGDVLWSGFQRSSRPTEGKMALY